VKKPQLTRWRVTLGLLGLLVVLVAVTSLSGSRPTIEAPRTAAAGELIHVTALRLRSATYALVLVSGRIPPHASYCETVLGTAGFADNEQQFAVRIPRTIPCFRGNPVAAPASVRAAGSVATAGGRDELIVGVRANGGFSDHASVVRRALSISS
jgi:hypothetical protein